jgi:hypothetical protein
VLLPLQGGSATESILGPSAAHGSVFVSLSSAYMLHGS